MFNDQFYEVLRYFNIVAATSLVCLSIAKYRHAFMMISLANRLRYSAWIALLFSVAYGTIEILLNDIEPGFRITFVAGSLALGLVAYLIPDPADDWMMFWHRLFKRKK